MGTEVCRKVETNNEGLHMQIKTEKCMPTCMRQNHELDQVRINKVEPIQFSEIEVDDRDEAEKQNQYINGKTAINLDLEASPHRQMDPTSYDELKLMQQKSNNEAIIIEKSKEGVVYLNNPDNFQPISVPYSIIKLMIHPQILKQIKKYGIDFHNQHGHEKAETYRTWRLLKSGAYANRISDGTAIIVKEKEYYRGTVVNNYVPEGEGLLITLFGSYKGYFKQGKAHGQGSLKSADGKSVYEGTWKTGELQKGKITTDEYKYEGQLLRCVPHGRGLLNIIKSKVQYIGAFKNGLFDDTEATYKCQNYTYRGQFVKGQKQGFGMLTPIKKTNSGSVKTLGKLTGKFEQDVFKKSQQNL